jgi:hypothetical protein
MLYSLLTFCFCSFGCRSHGDVICGTFAICLAIYTTIGTTYTNVGTPNGAILAYITFYAFTFVRSYSLTLEPKALFSSTLVFLLKTLIGDFVLAFFLFFNATYISSLILFTLVDGFCAFSFRCLKRH